MNRIDEAWAVEVAVTVLVHSCLQSHRMFEDKMLAGTKECVPPIFTERQQHARHWRISSFHKMWHKRSCRWSFHQRHRVHCVSRVGPLCPNLPSPTMHVSENRSLLQSTFSISKVLWLLSTRHELTHSVFLSDPVRSCLLFPFHTSWKQDSEG